jgi:hypothetical protein
VIGCPVSTVMGNQLGNLAASALIPPLVAPRRRSPGGTTAGCSWAVALCPQAAGDGLSPYEVRSLLVDSCGSGPRSGAQSAVGRQYLNIPAWWPTCSGPRAGRPPLRAGRSQPWLPRKP